MQEVKLYTCTHSQTFFITIAAPDHTSAIAGFNAWLKERGVGPSVSHRSVKLQKHPRPVFVAPQV